MRVGVKTLSDDTNALVSRAGTVKVIGPDGTEVILDENMATVLGSRRTTRRPAERSCPPPRSRRPGDGTVYAFQRKAPRVKLKWEPVDGADTYRIVVARDSEFDEHLRRRDPAGDLA